MSVNWTKGESLPADSSTKQFVVTSGGGGSYSATVTVETADYDYDDDCWEGENHHERVVTFSFHRLRTTDGRKLTAQVSVSIEWDY